MDTRLRTPADATRRTREELSAALGPALGPLRRLRAARRLGEIAVFAALWAAGIALGLEGLALQGPGAWGLRLAGLALSGIALNAFYLLSHEGHHHLLFRRPAVEPRVQRAALRAALPLAHRLPRAARAPPLAPRRSGRSRRVPQLHVGPAADLGPALDAAHPRHAGLHAVDPGRRLAPRRPPRPVADRRRARRPGVRVGARLHLRADAVPAPDVAPPRHRGRVLLCYPRPGPARPDRRRAAAGEPLGAQRPSRLVPAAQREPPPGAPSLPGGPELPPPPPARAVAAPPPPRRRGHVLHPLPGGIRGPFAARGRLGDGSHPAGPGAAP